MNIVNKFNLRLGLSVRVFLQVPQEDFTEIFLLAAKFITLYIFLALSAHLDFEIHQVDIVATYKET